MPMSSGMLLYVAFLSTEGYQKCSMVRLGDKERYCEKPPAYHLIGMIVSLKSSYRWLKCVSETSEVN